jgi:hypothetical protein
MAKTRGLIFRSDHGFSPGRNRKKALELGDRLLDAMKAEGWGFHSMATVWDRNWNGYEVTVIVCRSATQKE